MKALLIVVTLIVVGLNIASDHFELESQGITTVEIHNAQHGTNY